MPRISTEGTTEEEIEEWLGRLEEEGALPSDYETFQRILKGELQMPDGSTVNYNESQIEALWDAKGVDLTLADIYIHGLNIKYPWGTERRYGIQGMPGLWGWNSVMQIMEAETET
jgi:hypothetical protein